MWLVGALYNFIEAGGIRRRSLYDLIKTCWVDDTEVALVVLGELVIGAAGIFDAFQPAVTFELVFDDLFVEWVHSQEGTSDLETSPVVAVLEGLFQLGLEGGNEAVFVVGLELVDKGIGYVFEQGAAGDESEQGGREEALVRVLSGELLLPDVRVLPDMLLLPDEQVLPDDPIIAEKGIGDPEGIAVIGKQQFDAVDVGNDVAEMVEGNSFDIFCPGGIFFGPELGGDLFGDDAFSLCAVEQDEQEKLFDLRAEQMRYIVAFAIEGSKFAEEEDRIGDGLGSWLWRRSGFCGWFDCCFLCRFRFAMTEEVPGDGAACSQTGQKEGKEKGEIWFLGSLQ